MLVSCFLVAHPSFTDAFAMSVQLLLEHGTGGSMAVAVNQPIPGSNPSDFPARIC